METRTIAARPDVALATTSARVTPTPPRASRFGEVLANTAVRSAETAMRQLPGSPVMAVAVRAASGGGGAIGVPLTPTMAGSAPALGGIRGGSPEGPIASGSRVTSPGGNLANPAGIAGAGGENANIESSLQQSQDMNLYYLQVQEAVNAQNRSFTTLSNVLKAEHDTVKTAIGNIR